MNANKLTGIDWLPFLKQLEANRKAKRERFFIKLRLFLMNVLFIIVCSVSLASLGGTLFFGLTDNWGMVWLMVGVCVGSYILMLGVHFATEYYRRVNAVILSK